MGHLVWPILLRIVRLLFKCLNWLKVPKGVFLLGLAFTSRMDSGRLSVKLFQDAIGPKLFSFLLCANTCPVKSSIGHCVVTTSVYILYWFSTSA